MLNPGERVTLITKIAAALGERDYDEVDLILEQFEFRTSENWPGDQHSYVVERVKNASDTKLLTLHAYLFPEEAPAPEGPEARDDAAGGIWKPGFFRLFISHSSKQMAEVGELRRALRAHAIDGFVAHQNIEPTAEWQDAIETALRTCEAFLTYLTPDFHPSDWTDQEVGVALARAVLIIPVRRGATPYGFMGKYQALQGANKRTDRLAEEINTIISGHRLTKDRFKSAKARVKVAPEAGTPAGGEYRRSLNKLKRLEDAGLTDLFEDDPKLWRAMAIDAYSYTSKFVLDSGHAVRREDVVPTLMPALEVSDKLRSFLAQRELTQAYWYTWFAELIVDRLWPELDR
jgi:hypothetical protein